MKDEILSYWEMCSRQGKSLQRGMYFHSPPEHGIILMSRRRNAPYKDVMSSDEAVLEYEGHDEYHSSSTRDPKTLDQPRYNLNKKPTQNGLFADWVDKQKMGQVDPSIFRVYEKIRAGIWTDRGLFTLSNYQFVLSEGRKVFKFVLEAAGYDSQGTRESTALSATASRQIPSWIKLEVYKRDKGQCVICSATDNLHFDHDFPFSKGGTSILPENVRILCARHNLSKSANIE